jgi:hypothetical protein
VPIFFQICGSDLGFSSDGFPKDLKGAYLDTLWGWLEAPRTGKLMTCPPLMSMVASRPQRQLWAT